MYAFSGKIECLTCGSGYRRHHISGERAWTCKQHIKKAALCPAMPVREKVIEEEFVKALNGLVKNRDEVVKVVGESVNYALAETGEDIDKSDELREIDDTIETLQEKILEINKQRVRREINQEQYNNGSRKVMGKLDKLFVERDKILSEQKTATLSKAFQAVVAEFINKAGEQAEFDKDIFTRLVDKICIKGREKIVFKLKDETDVMAIIQ